MLFLKTRFVSTLFLSSLLTLLLGGAALLFFLPWVYSAEVLDGEKIVVIRAPQGGILRSLRVEQGQKVRGDAIVAEILTTDFQPPDVLLARSILYKRVENARYESQRGGLKEILLKPDLRARLALDRDYARFVGEQRLLFRSFQRKLSKATKFLQDERSRLEIQVKGMGGELASLTKRQALLEREFAEAGGSELRSEVRRNRRSLLRNRKQLEGLQRKVRSNAKALLKVTLRVRREESVDFEKIRSELNALYARIGLPSNAFDRLGFVERSGGQRLRRLIARKPGRVLRVVEGVRPGDVVVRGQVLVEILPNGHRSSYRLRLEDGRGILSSAFARGEVRVRSLRCKDFSEFLSWRAELVEGVLSLERALLQSADFPSLREGGRCSLVLELAGEKRRDFVKGFVREVFRGEINLGKLSMGIERMRALIWNTGEKLWAELDSLQEEKKKVIWKNFVEDIENAKN